MPFAGWMLEHAPAHYNPVPEIFIERGRQAEITVNQSATQTLAVTGTPTKFLHHWLNVCGANDLCAKGKHLAGNHTVDLGGE